MAEENQIESNIPETIPYPRFKEVNDKKKELENQLADMTTKFSALEQERDSFKKQVDDSKGELTKVQIATKYKLPPELADRLRGTTPEELDADAQKLAKLIELPNPGVPDVPRGADTTAPATTEEQRLENLIKSINIKRK